MVQIDQQTQALLWTDAGSLILGANIALIELSAIAVYCFRRRPRSGLLLWFGAISLLYGVRLLSQLDTIHAFISLTPAFWRYLISFIAYAIIVPFALFVEEIYGKGWKSSLRILLWIQVGYAVAAILSDSIRRSAESLPDPVYLFFPCLAAVLVLGLIVSYRPPMFEESRAIFFGLSIFVIFVVHEHLVEWDLLPWSLHLEALGFLLFLVLLGVIAVRRFVINEQRLSALQHEMEAAWRIQASILPQELPKVAGCTLAVRYLPMASVAGDFYDFAREDDSRLGILIADVAGHGVPAALIASMVKVAFSSAAAHWADPSATLSGLNHVLYKQQTGQLVTAAYLLLDCRNATALYSGAAHPPLLLWRRAEGKILEFAENGLPLGFRQREAYANVSIRLVSGDRILIYTDGITEAVNQLEDQFGSQRFKEFIRDNSQLPPDRFADLLLQEVAAWSDRKTGGTLDDDLTLIVADIH